MKLKLFFYLCMLPFLCFAQETNIQLSNRYGMKMTRNEDGTYALLYAKKYAKFIDVKTIPDVMLPYTYQPDLLKSKDYKGILTKDFVFKKYKDYELVLTVDFAESGNPNPFVIYIHGGGWARGDNSSSKTLSQYLAKQKGITGIRVSYTLAPQSNATVLVSIEDIRDALKYVQEHAKELNINPNCFGFLGTSAGAHLAAVAAMTIPGTKAFVGYSGIYDLEKAEITMKTKDPQRIAYFCNRDPKVLREVSPVNLIPRNDIPVSMLVCGSCDVTVECEQSEMFAAALKKKGAVCNLLKYKYYDHNLSSKTSDKMEEIFFKSVDFLTHYIK
ncbi:alpha/beta hydrolase [Bacteroidaceae bacterium HV4-6-C5C]|jgi:Esterase/lipase|nr:alpha/beta hydrolase [Bacteroidaceae bacterium HV4-6-C5C]